MSHVCILYQSARIMNFCLRPKLRVLGWVSKVYAEEVYDIFSVLYQYPIPYIRAQWQLDMIEPLDCIVRAHWKGRSEEILRKGGEITENRTLTDVNRR